MIVGNRENIFKSGFNPPALVYALAFGAMSVTAGIIVIFDITAGIALIDVIAIMGGSAAFNGIHHFDTGTILDKMGIAVRTGHHCNEPLMDRFNIGGTVRASFAMYNTRDEIDQLYHSLLKVKDMFG